MPRVFYSPIYNVSERYKIGTLVKVVPFWNANGTEKYVSDVGIIVSNTDTLCDHPFFDIFEYEMDCEEICYKVSIRGRIFLFTDLELEIINAPKK